MKDGQSEKKREEIEISSEKTSPDCDFTIVGVGGSAGSISPIKSFLETLPSEGELSLVILLHLQNREVSELPKILGRCTDWEVKEIAEGEKIEAHKIYVGPPGCKVEIDRGAFHLVKSCKDHLRPQEINYFFNSLGNCQREKGAAIVFSGMGTDGALGLKTIKEKGGFVFVQDPVTADYPSMPEAALNTGLVDARLSPGEMAQELVRYISLFQQASERGKFRGENEKILSEIIIYLKKKKKNDFSGYKIETLLRRLQRRMALNGLVDPSKYLELLKEDGGELERLFSDLLIGVTEFFRNPDQFEVLKEEAFRHILEYGPESRERIRIWVPGCSSGEEAYSIAIALEEFLENRKESPKIQIFATDINHEALKKARRGVYPSSIKDSLSPERLDRFFVEENNHYKIREYLREKLVFAPQNVLWDPPFSRLDLISCRNLLIYLQKEMQERVIQLFHYGLHQGGILFLGNSESLYNQKQYFKKLHPQVNLFERQEKVSTPPLNFYPSSFFKESFSQIKSGDKEDTSSLNLRREMERELLRRFTFPAVVVNSKDEIEYVHGQTGEYLELAPGKARMNLLEMARSGIRVYLRQGLKKVREEGPSHRRKVTWQPEGERQILNLCFRLLKRGGEEFHLVVFEKIRSEKREELKLNIKGEEGAEREKKERVKELEEKLANTKDRLENTIEELETSNENLQSLNEELLSSNEELQSTNEELATSKEEVQSVNEELSTVNDELEEKVLALSEANADLKNLLDSTSIATIFLDRDLKIKRFNPSAVQLYNFIESDLNRPLSNISSNFQKENISEYCREVLISENQKEVELQDKKGNWYLSRFHPYRDFTGSVEGVVITFTDITRIKKLEENLRTSEQRMSNLLKALPDAFLEISPSGEVLSIQPFGQGNWLITKRWKGRSIVEFLPPQLSQRLLTHLSEGEFQEIFTCEFSLSDEGEERSCELRMVRTKSKRAVLVIRDITQRKILEREVLEISEKERERIGHELHDNIGQILSGSLCLLKNLEKKEWEEEAWRNELEKIREFIKQAVTEVGNLAEGLAPIALEGYSLGQAIKQVREQFKTIYPERKIEVVDNLEEPLYNYFITLQIYRITQEALHNAFRHGQARCVKIEMKKKEVQGVLTIRDDGTGFDPSGQRRGMGLRIMEYRAHLIGGELQIDSARGKGTELQCTFAFSEETDQSQ